MSALSLIILAAFASGLIAFARRLGAKADRKRHTTTDNDIHDS